MTTPSRYWADWTTADFAALQASGQADQAVALLPLAATEQHGPHLPVSVDTVLVNGMVAAALPQVPEAVKLLVLPTQAVGLSPEHVRFPGTLTLKNETIIRLWTDVAEGVAACGIRKLVLFNAHGGNVSVMDMVARDLRARLDMLVYSVSWFNLPLQDPQGGDVNDLFCAQEHRFGVHGGDIETSLMLALDPTHVKLHLAQDFASTAQQRAAQFELLGNGRSAKLAWQMQDYNAAGAVGHAANASASKGQALLAAAAQALAKLLTEVHQLPLSTLQSTISFR